MAVDGEKYAADGGFVPEEAPAHRGENVLYCGERP